MKEFFLKYIDSPVGVLKIAGRAGAITSVSYAGARPGSTKEKAPEFLERCAKELGEYFDGKRREFTVKLSPEGTDFQMKVWMELLKIPYGETVSYQLIAERTGNPKAARAVGMANNKNPLAIIVPCHRVIGKNGKMVGYATGIWKKEWLLSHERENMAVKSE